MARRSGRGTAEWRHWSRRMQRIGEASLVGWPQCRRYVEKGRSHQLLPCRSFHRRTRAAPRQPGFGYRVVGHAPERAPASPGGFRRVASSCRLLNRADASAQVGGSGPRQRDCLCGGVVSLARVPRIATAFPVRAISEQFHVIACIG